MFVSRGLFFSLALFSMLAASAAATAADSMQPTQMQIMIDEENAKCEKGIDSMACIKVRAMRFLDTVMNNNNFKISDMEVKENGFKAPVESQSRSNSDDGFFAAIENYIQGHDVTMNLPTGEAKVTLTSRNLANNELSLNLKFSDDETAVVEGKGKKGNIFKKGKKHRLRKMIMPIMVLILLKAITVIPMAIGILKIKALNALGLGFLSFIVSVGLAIFQLCKKIAAEHHSAHITSHGVWDGRKLDSSFENYKQNKLAQNLAYKGYA